MTVVGKRETVSTTSALERQFQRRLFVSGKRIGPWSTHAMESAQAA